jgi:large subunit ribosomal protein L29
MADEKFSALVKQERAELSALDADGLKTRLDEAKKKLWTLRFTHGKRMLNDTAEIANTRKTIARINMYLHRVEAAK